MKNLLRALMLLSILVCASVNTEAQTAFRFFSGTLAQRPVSCVASDVYWSANTSHLYIGAGAPCSWVDFGAGAGGAGTVTSVSVTTANGVSGVVATATTTPAITLTLGAITPMSVNGLTVTTTTGTFTLTNGKTLAVTNSLTLSGTDSTTITFQGTDTYVGRTTTDTLTNKTLTSPVITNIAPGADFTITQNSVAAITSVNAGALVNTLVTSAGQVGVGKAPAAKLDVLGDAGLTVVNIAGTQPVAQSGANPGTSGGSAFVLVGSAGGDTSSTTANTNGGAGSSINQTAGAGGQQTGASSGTARGGNGGTFNQTSGAGGNATAVTGTIKGGAGGGVNRTAAGGGTSATSTGGAGGGISDAAGTGGVTTAAAVSGAGGAYSGVAGNGGANANAAGTAGGGGNWTADAGAAGANTGGAAAGLAGAMSFGVTNTRQINIGNAGSTVTVTGSAISFSNTIAPVANAGGDLGLSSFRWKQLWLDATITSIGTTGNQTINKAAGTVNIAAAGSSVTVTNSLCTTNSLVFAVIRTNDTTAVIKNVVPSNGSFIITLNAATTAAISIGFFVLNQ